MTTEQQPTYRGDWMSVTTLSADELIKKATDDSLRPKYSPPIVWAYLKKQKQRRTAQAQGQGE